MLQPTEIMIGKAVPAMIEGAIQATNILLVAELWFRIPFQGSYLTLYAGLILFLLAAVGIYGLMAFLVGRRTPEIGVRMALGAQRQGIFRLVIGHALRLTAIGIVLGVAGAMAAAQALRSLLFGVAPTDLFTIALAVAVLAVVAFVAAAVPALSAAKVDPIMALRYE